MTVQLYEAGRLDREMVVMAKTKIFPVFLRFVLPFSVVFDFVPQSSFSWTGSATLVERHNIRSPVFGSHHFINANMNMHLCTNGKKRSPIQIDLTLVRRIMSTCCDIFISYNVIISWTTHR